MAQSKKIEQTFINENMAEDLYDSEEQQKLEFARVEAFTIGNAEGRASGLEQGREEGKIETAKAFLRLGVPIETVALGTGFSIKELSKLMKDV